MGLMYDDVNGRHENSPTLTVGELIEELGKYPKDAKLGHWAINAALRGDVLFIHKILGTEYCRDGKTVAIIGGFE